MISRIVLDADGVLTDFCSAAALAHGWTVKRFFKGYPRGQYGINQYMGLASEYFWKPLDTPEFWSKVPFYRGAPEFVRNVLRISNRFGQQVVVATQATANPATLGAKAELLATLGLPLYCCWNGDKKPFDNGTTLLVDDCDQNLAMWQGPAILVPQLWNSNNGTPFLVRWQDYGCPNYGSLLSRIRAECSRNTGLTAKS